MSLRALIDQIAALQVFAVAGASRSEEKESHQLYLALRSSGKTVYALNPNAEQIAGDPCYAALDNVPEQIECLVTVTQPEITEALLQEAARLNIRYVWMQPGSESEAAIHRAQAWGMQVVANGACLKETILERAAA